MCCFGLLYDKPISMFKNQASGQDYGNGFTVKICLSFIFDLKTKQAGKGGLFLEFYHILSFKE